MKNVIITSVLSLMLATGASAKNLYVSTDGSASNDGTSWNTSVNDLGTAYAKSVKGDVIYMAAGTYVTTSTINMIEGVHVYGGFAKGETSIENRVRPNALTEPWKFANETIITSAGDFRLVDRVDKNNFWENTIIDGITIKGHSTANARVLYLRNSVTLQNCQILNNACTGTVVYGEENMLVRDCYFSGNKTSDPTKEAIALQLRGCHNKYYPGNKAEGCVFDDNLATSLSIYNTNEAGGVQESDQDGTSVNKCVFKNNKAACITVNNQWTKRYLKITNCLFEGNTANTTGTVISGNSEVYYDFASNVVRNNTNTAPAGDKAWRNAIIATKKNAQISNCLIVNNSSENLLVDIQSSTLFNNTIANNKGTVYVGENYATVINSVMVNNEATHNSKSVYPIENSAIQFCATDQEIVTTNSGVLLENNVVDATPFVRPTTFVGSTTDATNIQAINNADFSLNSASKCVNAGSINFENDFFMTPEWVSEFMSKDVDGNNRIVDGKINIGAYQGGKTVGFDQTKENIACEVTVDANTIYVSAEKDGFVALYNVNGSQIASKAIVGGNAIISVAQKGLYLVKVIAADQAKTFKVVIK